MSISKNEDVVIVLLVLSAIWFAVPALAEEPSASESYQQVRDLNPIGYWPLDEGQGEVAHDRSGNDNHGKIYHVPWENGFLNFTSLYQWIEIPIVSDYQGKEFTIGGWIFTRREDYRRKGMLFFGAANPSSTWKTQSTLLRIRTGGKIEVVSGSKTDVIDSVDDGVTISANMWQHIMYTYKAGTGRLYVNGKLVQSKDNVIYNKWDNRFLIGAGADWWHLPRSRSLDGSIRDVMIFDRALLPETVSNIYELTRPTTKPVNAEKVGENEEVEEDLSLEELTTILRNNDAAHKERIQSALKIKEMDNEVQEKAVPVVVDVLEKILEEKGIHMPRVEDHLRNILIRILLNYGKENENVRDVLGKSFAKPLFDIVDTSKSELNEVQDLVEEGSYMDALDIYRNLSAKKRDNNFFSQGDPYRDSRPKRGKLRDYTASAEYKGKTYIVGKGKAWEGVNKVSVEDYEKIVNQLADKFPKADDWRSSDYPHLYRVKITKKDEEGNIVQTAFLEGDWFIFDGSSAKVRAWSVAVDKDGYIHIMGGQHNTPDPDRYIPGSWEKIGISRNGNSSEFPAQMYWVSEEPGSIELFKFVGQKNNPRSLPTDYWNYMNFVQDYNDELFTYGRINSSGFQSWGLYRYHVDERRWTPVGGDPYKVIESAENKKPDWTDFLVHQVRGGIPTSPGSNKALVWSWQPHFYNWCRSNWGVYFDRTGRMHVNMPIWGLGERAQLIDDIVYAYSDDGGDTFYRADGTEVELPLTVNPAPEHNARLQRASTLQWWNLWTSLLEYAGYNIPHFSH